MSRPVARRHHSRGRTASASTTSGMITSAGLVAGLLALWVLLGAAV
jgi:hypothetical protein